jgi:tetratricopeptide (TPR) repeat protein
MTGPRFRFVRGAVVQALLLGAAACAPLFDRPKPVEIRPVETPSADGAAADDNAYRSATTAIDNRDYALALEHLQAARERQPRDVRMLNAFGVVYDKLGRFDLSARYYAQARAIDPRSTIVLGNITYSHALQGLANHELVTSALADAIPLRPDAAPPEPAPELRAAANAGSAPFTPVAAGHPAQPDAHSGDAGLGAVPASAELPEQHSAQSSVKLTGHPAEAAFSGDAASDCMDGSVVVRARWKTRASLDDTYLDACVVKPSCELGCGAVSRGRFRRGRRDRVREVLAAGGAALASVRFGRASCLNHHATGNRRAHISAQSYIGHRRPRGCQRIPK